MCSVYHLIITQQMDNVALSCLLTMANVAVHFVAMEFVLSGMWASWLLTHSRKHKIYILHAIQPKKPFNNIINYMQNALSHIQYTVNKSVIPTGIYNIRIYCRIGEF